MKTVKHLFEKLTTFENLLTATKMAQRGKRKEPETYAFNCRLEENIFQLQNELISGEWRPGHYRDFWVSEPKKRLVSAAPYRDRVVHHAVVQVLEPVYEPIFIYDSYACRKGKGTHAAADRYTEFCRQAKHVLKCDISRYFENISHDKLINILSKKIKDDAFIRLMEILIRSNDMRSNVISGIGLPIGNLTSQFLANVYLNEFDHWIKDHHRIKRYIRYMDDFVILADEKIELWDILRKSEEFFKAYNLTLHPLKRTVFPVTEGCDFMGFRIWQDWRRLRPSTGYRSVRKLRRLSKSYERWQVDRKQVQCSLLSFIGHVKHADTWGLRRAIFRRLKFRRGTRRQLETEFCEAVTGTITTTTTSGAPIATTIIQQTRTTTTDSGLPASPTMPGLMPS